MLHWFGRSEVASDFSHVGLKNEELRSVKYSEMVI